MTDIVPLNYSHLNAVTRLHMAHLRTQFHGYAGKQLLTVYYSALMRSGSACGYVAIENNNVAGFICGVWDSAGLHSTLLRGNLPDLLMWGIVQILSRPSIVIHLINRMKLLVTSADSQQRSMQYGYELRPIVVSPDFRGTGIAKQLVNHLSQDAALRGFERIFLYTEADNAAANAFYRKIGFEYISKHFIGSTAYFRYELSTVKS